MPLNKNNEKTSAAWIDAMHASFSSMTEGEVRAALCDYIARCGMGDIARITWTVAQARAEGGAKEKAAMRAPERAEAVVAPDPSASVGLPGSRVLCFPGSSPRF